jgi:hypothetical protein
MNFHKTFTVFSSDCEAISKNVIKSLNFEFSVDFIKQLKHKLLVDGVKYFWIVNFLVEVKSLSSSWVPYFSGNKFAEKFINF